MLLVRAAATVCFTLASFASAGAQPQQQEPKILEISSSSAGVTSWRRLETRTTTGDSSRVTTVEQTPSIERGWKTDREITTETRQAASGATHVRQDVYTYGVQRERVLLERTESDQGRLPDTTVQSISHTWTADVNGRLGLLSQTIEEHRSDAGAAETTTRVSAPDVDGKLTESTRTTENERQISPGVVRRNSSVMHRDLNGGWQPTERRDTDVRDTGATERLEEETVSRPDMSGVMGISETNVTRRSQANGRENILTERYVPRDQGARHRSASRMDLSERIRVSTTTANDGTRETIEEFEGRNLVAAAEPMRLLRRVVTIVRPLGGDRVQVERQTFDLDANGRLALTATERREGSAP